VVSSTLFTPFIKSIKILKELLIYGIITGICLLAFLISLIFALVKKKYKIIFISMLFLILGIVSGLITSYKFVSKSYNRVTIMLESRSGIEIYTALFGKSSADCVEVIHKQDQIIPKIDYAIWLHFKTCPNELSRILALKDFEFNKSCTDDLNTTDHPWFKPELLGDTVLVYSCFDIRGNGQILYCNQDSTEVFCKDIWD